MIQIRVTPGDVAETPRLLSLLAQFPEHGRTFKTESVHGQQVLICGADEVQLEKVLRDLTSVGVAFAADSTRVIFRETVAQRTTGDFTHKRLHHGIGEFARVILEVIPREIGSGYQFQNMSSPEHVPSHFVEGIVRGIDSVIDNDLQFGSSCTDICVALKDGAYHPTDSTIQTFEIAARATIRDALHSAGTVVLQPIMVLTVQVPLESIGRVIDGIHQRKGIVSESSTKNEMGILQANVAMANLLGYSRELHDLTLGRGTYAIEFSHYEAMSSQGGPQNFPPAIAMRA